MLAKKNEYISKAYDNLLHISADEQKRLEYEARQKAIRDHEWLMKTSHDQGFKEGETAGFSKGETAGFSKGEIHATASAICDLLNELGSIPHELKDIIFSQPDLDILKKWLRLAAKAESIEEFKSMISL